VWQASATFAAENLGKVEAAFREEVALALKSGFTAQELQDAKVGLLNLRRLSRAQDGSLAGLLASNLYLGRTMAWSEAIERSIQAATLEQVNAALVKYLKPESFVVGVGGDFKAP
jgi:zinc protease